MKMSRECLRGRGNISFGIREMMEFKSPILADCHIEARSDIVGISCEMTAPTTNEALLISRHIETTAEIADF